MNEKLLPLYLFLFFIMVLLSTICIPKIISKWKEKYYAELRIKVKNTSVRYQELLRVTQNQNFFDINQTFCFFAYVSSKFKYDSFDFDSFFKERIYCEMKKVDDLITKVKHNKGKYPEYKKAFNDIYMSVPDTKKRSELNFIETEKEMLLECRGKITISPDFVCIVRYSSPQGRNTYEKSKTYSFENLIELRECVIKEEVEKTSESYRRKTERNKMSDSLRYDILKRDDFRCVLCGRSAKDGISLEVDHIIPISKGGKTITSNLQTLCKDCNRGKRDKYDSDNM